MGTIYQNSVIVPRVFFLKERKSVYGDWKFAFWRELFQNSTDPQVDASEISITMEPQDGFVKVTFDDNGPGMSREVLNEVYFQLGKSTKDGTDSVGGFGRARILTCFSMLYYKIWTQDTLVDGSGPGYNLHDVDAYYHGCKLEVGVDEATPDELRNALNNYLRYSSLNCRVTVNGTDHTSTYNRGNTIRTLDHPTTGEPFATVYVHDDDDDYWRHGVMVVRVNGTMMFKTHVHGLGTKTVTVEITPEHSRSILSASRDSFVEPYDSVLNEFKQEMAANTKSSLKPQTVKKRMLFSGSGLIEAKRQQGDAKRRPTSGSRTGEALALMEMIESGKLKIGRGATGTGGSVINVSQMTMDERENLVNSLMNGAAQIEEGDNGEMSFSPIPACMIHIEVIEGKILKASEKFMPSNWKWTLDGGKVKWVSGANEFRLLEAWRISLEEAVNAYLRYMNGGYVRWGVGFYFGDDNAIHIEHNDAHFFLINPLKEDATQRYAIRDRGSCKRLMAEAKHEVAHLQADYHNEYYASALTQIDASFAEWDVFAKIVGIKA